MKFTKISFENKDSYLWIGFGLNEKKSLTTLSVETLEELREAVSQAHRSVDLKGVIFFSHKKDCFLAGVDVSLINSLRTEEQASDGAAQGQQIFNMIEDLKCPTIALIDGICLGGGLELALACQYIAVSDSPKTKLGLPEVMLGVLPGFGGTYRLPKKVGLTSALDMILTGKQIRASQAIKNGLADYKVSPFRIVEKAIDLIEGKIPKKEKKSSALMGFAENFTPSRSFIFKKAREGVLKKTKGFYPAPLKILEVMERANALSRDEYLAKESQAFGELSQTTQSQSLQHIFFASDQAKKIENKDALQKFQTGGVLGAGTMGGGIAWLMVKNNMAVLMKDMNQAGLNLGLKQASDIFSKLVKRKRMSFDDFNRKMSLIHPTLNFQGFKKIDLLVEAIVENMDVKKKVLAQVEDEVASECVVTTNTSSLSVTEMASALKKPERFAGLHFFNPVNKMPLVEIITHPKVSADVINSLKSWVLKTGKTPVVVKDGPGFLVNRILAPYLNEAAHLLEEGVAIVDVDQAALDFGMPMGPCRLMDEVGLDVSQKVGDILFKELGERFKPSSLSGKLVDQDLLGKKNGKGFYVYDSPKEEVNSEVYHILPESRKNMSSDDIQMRLVLPMLNEAIYCLQEGIVDSAANLDLALIFGIGFPPFRGGVLKYADSVGIEELSKRMNEYKEQVSNLRYQPHGELEKMAKSQKTFYP